MGEKSPDWQHPTAQEMASVITDELPVCDVEGDSDLISLVDIVVTGIEAVPWTHFWVRKYDPDADGEKTSWAVLTPLPSAGDTKADGTPIVPVELFAPTVRKAVYDYLLSRLYAGMDLSGARQLVDGSYTDAVVADSILQTALYGSEVFS